MFSISQSGSKKIPKGLKVEAKPESALSIEA